MAEMDENFFMKKMQALGFVLEEFDYQDLLQCRLVCYEFYHSIKRNPRLIDKFRFKLTLDGHSVLDSGQPPFSIIFDSNIKLKSITIKEDFLDIGNTIAVVDANKIKMFLLSSLLSNIKAFETVTEMIVYAREDEPRTNVQLMAMILQMRNLKVLKFTLPSFVHCLEAGDSTIQCNSLEHVKIIHNNCKRLTVSDFQRMLNIFPNIKRIDMKVMTMELGEHVYIQFAPLIKSIETLDVYTLADLANMPNIPITNITLECCAFNLNDGSALRLFEFISADRVETVCLKLKNASTKWFYRRLDKVTDLDLSTDRRSSHYVQSQLCNILEWTPNLKKLTVKFKTWKHQFGHEVIELKDLTEVTLKKFHIKCTDCTITILKTMVNVKLLRLKPLCDSTLTEPLPLLLINSIASYLQQLECFELMYDNGVMLHNYFESWPAMPKLKQLVVNRVGHVTEAAIRNLQAKCPSLEVIKLYSLRGSTIDSLLELTLECFPNIEIITFRGGRTTEITQLDYIQGNVGWRLKKLDITPSIGEAAILNIFENNNMLETICCNYGALQVTRRIYYEVSKLNAYDLKSVEEPMKSRRRLYLEDIHSSDSETSDDEKSENESHPEDDDDQDDQDDPFA